MQITIPLSLIACLAVAAAAPSQSPPRTKELRTNVSIVDYLKANGQDYTVTARRKLYQARFGDVPFSGTYAENIRLFESLLLENAAAARDATCKIDTAVVPLQGVANRKAFDALPIDQLRIATMDRNPSRKGTQPRFYVVLSARETRLPTTAGHAWVAFGIHGYEKDDEHACIGTAFGSYPEEGKTARLSLIKTVPGKVVQGWIDNLGGASKQQTEKIRFVLEVDEASYVRARNVVNTTTLGAEYKLLTKDCAELVRAVAEAIGLKVAPRRENPLPTQVVEQLIQDNLPVQ